MSWRERYRHASSWRLVLAVPVLAVIALTAWALSSPAGSSPDDDFHLASIWCANPASSSCLAGDESDERVVPSIVHNAACFARDPALSGECQSRYLAAGTSPTVETDRGNFASNYPPVYYAFMSAFAGTDVLASVLLMRFINVIVFVGLASALFVLLPVRRRPALLLGWLVSTVPLGLFLIASNNPSSWALTGVGTAWLALLAYFETTGRRRIGLAVVFALASLIASGARADSAIYVIIGMIVVLVLTVERTRAYLVKAILPVAFAFVAFYFFIGSQQATVVSGGLGSAGDGAPITTNPLTLVLKALINVQLLWGGALGGWGLGWLDTALPGIVEFGGVVAFVGVVFVGIGVVDRRKGVALAIVALTLWLLPTYVLVKGLNEVGQNVQPRYILPLMVMLAGLAVLAVGVREVRFTRVQLGFVVAALAAANAIALHVNTRRYVTGTDSPAWNLDDHLEWWWAAAPSPMVVWFVGSVAYGALVLILAREITKAHEIQ